MQPTTRLPHPPAAATDAPIRWRLTLNGALIVCTLRTEEYIADPSVRAAVRMEAAHELAWKIAERGRQ